MNNLIRVKLNSMNDAKELINRTSRAEGKVFIKNDPYVIDGKSIMGLFSLNFESVLTVEFEVKDDMHVLDDFAPVVKIETGKTV